jgi:hypothetical protein
MEQNNSISKPMMVARKDITGQTIPMMVVSKDTTTTRQINRIAKPMMVSKTDTPWPAIPRKAVSKDTTSKVKSIMVNSLCRFSWSTRTPLTRPCQ